MEPRRPQGQPSSPSPEQRPTAPTGPRAPWDSAATERPPMLPAQQTAPWQQTGAPWQRPLERESAPWEKPERDGVPAQPDATRHAPVHRVPAAEPAAPVEEGPIGIEVPPWDAPPPFSLEEPPADGPYDAYAPLAEDFAPARAALRPRMTAPVLERPATSGGDARNSVFGDIFTRSAPQPEPPPTPAPREESAPPPAEQPAAEREFEAADEWPAEAAPSAEQDSPAAPDPLEWPPVPTDFPPADAQPTEYARQPSHDPLEWPPIPGELLHVPDRGTDGTAHLAVEEPPAAVESEWGEPAESEWSEHTARESSEPTVRAWSAVDVPVEVEPPTRFESSESAAASVAADSLAAEPELELEAPLEPAWDEPQAAQGARPAGERVFAPPIGQPAAEARLAGTKWAVFEPPLAPTDQDPADTWPAPTDARLDEKPAAAESSWTPAAHAAESEAALFEPASPDSTDRAPAPEAQSESLWAPEYGAAEPALEPTPISQPEPIGEQRGAVFARYAPQTIAPAVNVPAYPTASAEQPAAVAQPAHAEHTRHLWFLSRQAEEASAAAENAAGATPSSVQTLILTVLVALGVIALVILFLAVFTSFFG